MPITDRSPGMRRSVYFERAMLDEIRDHAFRLERSVSWVVDYAWRHGREAIERMPGPGEPALRVKK